MAIGGRVVTTMFEGERRFDITVRIGSTLVPTREGGRVPLSELAKLEVVTGANIIARREEPPPDHRAHQHPGPRPGTVHPTRFCPCRARWGRPSACGGLSGRLCAVIPTFRGLFGRPSASTGKACRQT